jgi:peptide/nickel transport system permease protein
MRDALERFLRTPSGVLGAVLLAVVAGAAVFAPAIAPGDPLAMAGRPMLAPFTDPALPLGTDRLGRDVLAGLLHGARSSLLVGLAAALAALGLGVAVGTAAGYLGGWADELLMRLTDAFQTVPGFILALALVSVLGPSLASVVAAIALNAWTGPARVVRAEVLSLRRRDFVDAYRVLGMPSWRIAFVEVLPNALPPVVSLGAVVVAGAILIEAALSFLGLGDPNRASWGAMIAEGRAVLRTSWHLAAIPGAAIALTVLAVSLVGEGLTEALTPRRARP